MSKRPKAAGGFHSVNYSLKMARKSGNFVDFYKVMRSKNVCKACALGMKKMRNEIGGSFQICKKSMQAIAQDLLKGIPSSFFEDNSIEDLMKFRGSELEAAGRLVEPLLAEEGDTHLKPISWTKAYDLVIDKLREVDPNRYFTYTSGRSSNEAAFLAQIFTRQYGTNNVNNCSYYCHQASGVGLKQTIGSGTSTVTLEDVELADMIVVIGANPSSNHPRFIPHLVDTRKQGGKVVIINPMKEVGLEEFRIPSRIGSLFLSSTVSDLYLQPHAGGDMAFLKAIQVQLLKNLAYNEEFVENYCDGWEELKEDLENEDLDELLLKSGISKQDFNEFYDMLINHDKVIFCWAMGVTHQRHGVQTVQSMANVQLMLGNIGRPGAGLLPLRGHSNVQGVGSVGVVPKLSPVVVDKIAEHMSLEVPEQEGMDTFACMEACHNGDVDLGIMLGGNLYGANPDSTWAAEALSKLDMTVYISTTMNLGHVYGRGKTSLILPVRVRDEEKQTTSQESMFNYVRISEGGFDAPVPTLPTEVELITHLAKELFGAGPVPWDRLEDHQVIREYISNVVPYLTPLKDLTPKGGEFTIPGRIKHTPEFGTDNKKAKLFVGDAPDGRPDTDSYNLITFRSEGQFNTIVYDEYDAFRGVDHRDVIFMSPQDMKAKQIEDGQWVEVSNSTGSLKLQAIEAPIRSLNVAMYFPEGNVLVPGKIDPLSKTPVFKRVPVTISLIEQT